MTTQQCMGLHCSVTGDWMPYGRSMTDLWNMLGTLTAMQQFLSRVSIYDRNTSHVLRFVRFVIKSRHCTLAGQTFISGHFIYDWKCTLYIINVCAEIAESLSLIVQFTSILRQKLRQRALNLTKRRPSFYSCWYFYISRRWQPHGRLDINDHFMFNTRTRREFWQEEAKNCSL